MDRKKKQTWIGLDWKKLDFWLQLPLIFFTNRLQLHEMNIYLGPVWTS